MMIADLFKNDEETNDRQPHEKTIYDYLTKDDLRELTVLDLSPREHLAWRYRRATQRWIKALIEGAHRKSVVAGDGCRSLRINYLEIRRLEKERKAKNRKAFTDAAYYADKKAEKQAWLETKERKALAKIDRSAAVRLKLLRAGTKRPRRDKRLQQIRGQEKIYVKIWRANELAHIKWGPEVSAAKVAQIYMESYKGENITRHQIRSRLRVIRELEQPGGVWASERLIDA
jgi:hypothetical protein